jgi:hypothetical protein
VQGIWRVNVLRDAKNANGCGSSAAEAVEYQSRETTSKQRDSQSGGIRYRQVRLDSYPSVINVTNAGVRQNASRFFETDVFAASNLNLHSGVCVCVCVCVALIISQLEDQITSYIPTSNNVNYAVVRGSSLSTNSSSNAELQGHTPRPAQTK